MFKILTDTREQKPLLLRHEYLTEQVTCTLPYGDYACEVNGTRVPFVFERKSKADLWGTLGGNKVNHERFKNEIAKAKLDNCKLKLIIECSYEEVKKGHKTYQYIRDKKTGEKKRVFRYSRFSGLAMVRKLNTLCLRYDLEYICCKNREEMSFYITEFFYSFAKNFKTKEG